MILYQAVAPKIHPIKYDKDHGLKNEYTEFPKIMSDTFPTHYVFGYPFAGQLTEEQLQHMLHQGSNIFSDDAM